MGVCLEGLEGDRLAVDLEAKLAPVQVLPLATGRGLHDEFLLVVVFVEGELVPHILIDREVLQTREVFAFVVGDRRAGIGSEVLLFLFAFLSNPFDVVTWHTRT